MKVRFVTIQTAVSETPFRLEFYKPQFHKISRPPNTHFSILFFCYQTRFSSSEPDFEPIVSQTSVWKMWMGQQCLLTQKQKLLGLKSFLGKLPLTSQEIFYSSKTSYSLKSYQKFLWPSVLCLHVLILTKGQYTVFPWGDPILLLWVLTWVLIWEW